MNNLMVIDGIEVRRDAYGDRIVQARFRADAPVYAGACPAGA